MVKTISVLILPLDIDYWVIETVGCEIEWWWVLFRKATKYEPKIIKTICRYASKKYKEKSHLTSLDYEILAVIYYLDAFMLFICNKQELQSEQIVKLL